MLRGELDLVLDVADGNGPSGVVPDACATTVSDRQEEHARRAATLDAARQFEPRGAGPALFRDETERKILRQANLVAVRERAPRGSDLTTVHGEAYAVEGRDAPASAGVEVLDEPEHRRVRGQVGEERQLHIGRTHMAEAQSVPDRDQEIAGVVDGQETAVRGVGAHASIPHATPW